MLFFRYRSTNCYFIESGIQGKLLAIDAGWPCSLLEYQRGMKSAGLSFKNVAWCIVTHFHMDHAGLVGQFAECGIACFATPEQVSYIDSMEKIILKNREYSDYKNIDKSRLEIADIDMLNAKLREHGIAGEIIATPSHSPDSISFIAHGGEAIVGDLAPLGQIMEDDAAALSDWARIKDCGSLCAFPSHAQQFDLD